MEDYIMINRTNLPDTGCHNRGACHTYRGKS
jgi:hypothetical protein